MRLSVFTPTHDPRFLHELAKSLEGQDIDEWVILANGCSAESVQQALTAQTKTFARVIEMPVLGRTHVGALKRHACMLCTGDILLEVDHDDLLLPKAASMVKAAFADPDVGFVYSDCIRFQDGKSWASAARFHDNHGWEYLETVTPYGRFEYPVTFQPTAASVSRIWYAPDHLRAWRTTVYREMGGHDPSFRVLDDHELMIRTYIHTKMKKIEAPLYMYRVHRRNTWTSDDANADIQTGTMKLYQQHIEALALRESALRGLHSVNLGAVEATRRGYTLHHGNYGGRAAKIFEGSGLDYELFDLSEDWLLEDDSVGLLLINDVLEHVSDKLHFINEAYRVLAHGGYILSQTPSTDGRGAFSDPTHVAYYNEASFRYYTHAVKAGYIGTPVKFQEMKCVTSDLDRDRNCWVYWHAAALKQGARPPGLIHI